MKPLSQRLTHRELLQRGDLTLCWRARDAVLDRPVFVKVLNPALAQDAEIRARFEREAKAVARLDHPNLVRIFEYGEDPEEGMYMILEWIEGTTLAQDISKGKRLVGEEFIRLARELLSGLAALHSVGILHRDLKPENILVREIQVPGSTSQSSRRTQYKITDFSLAALRDAPTLTHHETIVGTPAYMAPEQAAGAKPTERSDLFSAGVVLYEAAIGTNPWIGETMLDTMRRVRESEISFEHAAITNLPPQGRQLLERLLRKHPSARPSSANQALDLLGDHEPGGHRPFESSRRRNARFAVMAIFVLFAGIILIWNAGKPVREANSLTRPDSANNIGQVSRVDSMVPEFRSPTSPPETTSVELSGPDKKSREPNRLAALPKPVVQIALKDTSSTNPADSVDITVVTEPWAHIFFRGQQIGTTPLSAPLRLPSGNQEIELRNPAFPPIDLPLNAKQSSQINVRMAEHVARIGARVEPWGELYVDGEHIGTTPLTRPVYVPPGHHTIRVSHPILGSVQRDVDATPGQVLDLEVNLKTGTFLVAMDLEKGP